MHQRISLLAQHEHIDESVTQRWTQKACPILTDIIASLTIYPLCRKHKQHTFALALAHTIHTNIVVWPLVSCRPRTRRWCHFTWNDKELCQGTVALSYMTLICHGKLPNLLLTLGVKVINRTTDKYKRILAHVYVHIVVNIYIHTYI